jgi:hypothetical protein
MFKIDTTDGNNKIIVKNNKPHLGNCCCRGPAMYCCLSGTNWAPDQEFFEQYPNTISMNFEQQCGFVGGWYFVSYPENLPADFSCPVANCVRYDGTTVTFGNGETKFEAGCGDCIGDTTPLNEDGVCDAGYIQVGSLCVSLISNIPNCGTFTQELA